MSSAVSLNDITIRTELRSGDIGAITYLYGILYQREWGLGLGKKLMELYMAFLVQCGYKSSFLWTTHELDTAANLYHKHGFQLTEEKESTAFGKSLFERKYELVV